jgi:hypothetical protein
VGMPVAVVVVLGAEVVLVLAVVLVLGAVVVVLLLDVVVELLVVGVAVAVLVELLVVVVGAVVAVELLVVGVVVGVVVAVVPVDELVNDMPLVAASLDSPHAESKPIKASADAQRRALVNFITILTRLVSVRSDFLASGSTPDKLSLESDAWACCSM